MGKRSHKRREKDHLGCMSGLIHIFNFRQGQSTRRLITDRRRVNAKQPVGAVYMRDKLSLTATTNQRHEGSNTSIITSLRLQNGESKTSEMGKASVKALMDEEMSKVQKSKKKLPESVLEQIKHELLLQGSLEKSGMQENRNLNVNSCHPNSAEIFPVIDEFCSHNHYSQEAGLDQKTLNMPPVQKGLIVEERLETAMESFLNKKFIEAKKLSRGETLHQSKELKDALEILNLNKELFVKLLQDPNSLLMKHIQDLRNAQTAKLSKGDLGKPLPGARFSEQEVQDSRQTRMLVKQFYFQKQNGHHKFFGRKSKPKDENKLTESEICGSASRRIVVLKPSPSPSQSHFSLEEIKRKLKSVIGESRKEKHWMFIDKISYKRHHSTDCRETSPQNEKTSKVSTRPTSDKRGNSKEYKPQQREPFIYKEAKNHLTEMLEMENKDGDLAAKQLPKTLGRNFSSTENSTIPLRFSPGRAQERFSLNNIHSSTECVRQVNIERPANQLNPQMENGEDSNNPDAELGGSDLDTEFETGIISDDREDESNCIRGHFSPKDVEIKDITDSMCLEESESTEPDRSPVTEEYGHGHTGYSRQDLSGEKSQLLSLPESFSAGHILIHKNEALESIYEKPERLSPVSVLESLFSDSEISPATSVAQHGELSIQPRQIHFEKHNTSAPSEIVWDQEINPQPLIEEDKTSFKYIRTVLAASGMNCDELKRRGCSSDPPIDPSLLDEVGAPPRQISEDKKLLFDCINEALLEIYERYFGCTPWVSFIKSEIRPIPIGKNIVQEVLEGIDWCLLPLDSCTLDQIIGKDMAKVGSWMDLCSKAEKVGFEMGDSILDKLMEEMILELWD